MYCDHCGRYFGSINGANNHHCQFPKPIQTNEYLHHGERASPCSQAIYDNICNRELLGDLDE